MRNKLLLFFLSGLTLIFTSICFMIIDAYFSFDGRLKNAGYSSVVIEKAKNIFSKDEKEYLIRNYSKNMNSLISYKEFKYKNYSEYQKYINYINSNNINYDNRFIDLINNDLYKEEFFDTYNEYYKYVDLNNIKYDKRIIILINDKLYIKDYINKYYNYINKYPEVEYNSNIFMIINSNNYKEDRLEDYIYVLEKFPDVGYSLIIDLTNDLYFKKANTERYINYYNKNKSYSIRNIVENVNCNLDRDYYTNPSDTDMSKGMLLIVNKYYKLKENYVPKDLVKVGYGTLNRTAKEAFDKMQNEAKKANLNIFVVSGYRSYYNQRDIYNRYVSDMGRELTDTVSARPGHSEHQTGLAIDITVPGTNFTDFGSTKEFTWMKENSYKYGYILRYPKGKEKQTGYSFEAWHYRYVGEKVAKDIKEKNITFDEYYEYYLK